MRVLYSESGQCKSQVAKEYVPRKQYRVCIQGQNDYRHNKNHVLKRSPANWDAGYTVLPIHDVITPLIVDLDTLAISRLIIQEGKRKGAKKGAKKKRSRCI